MILSLMKYGPTAFSKFYKKWNNMESMIPF